MSLDEIVAAIGEPYFRDDAVVIYHADCRDILPLIAKVDLVLTDPPYGINWQGGKQHWPLNHGNVEWDERVEGLVDIVTVGRDAIVWGGHLYPLPVRRGWLIWDKKQNDSFSSGQAELAWTTLDQPIRTFRMSQVEAYCDPRDPKQHPAQKPRTLIKWCLQFTPDAQLILDPFMGSGTTLRAAKDLGRKAIGIEIEERYCEIAKRRMAQGVLL